MKELEFLEELLHRLTTNSEITFDNNHIIFPLGIYDRFIQEFVESKIKELKDMNGKIEHKCSFGFDEKFIGKQSIKRDPKLGESGWSVEKDDWVCSCGKTRRVALGRKRE